MHSLKIAQPLLASVVYFVLFSMILFSYVPGSKQIIGTHVHLLQDHQNPVFQRLTASVVLCDSNLKCNSTIFLGGFIYPNTLCITKS
jgi:hypothetical protein